MTSSTSPVDSGLRLWRSTTQMLTKSSSSRPSYTSPPSSLSRATTASSHESMYSPASSQSHRRSLSTTKSPASSSTGHTSHSNVNSATSRATSSGRQKPRPHSPPSMYATFDLPAPKKPRPNPYLKTRSQMIAQSHQKAPLEPPPPLINFSFKPGKLTTKLRRTLSPRSSSNAISDVVGKSASKSASAEPQPAFDPTLTHAAPSPVPRPPSRSKSSHGLKPLMPPPATIISKCGSPQSSPPHSAPSSFASTSTSTSASTPPRTPSPSDVKHLDKLVRTLGEPVVAGSDHHKNRRASSVPTISTITGRPEVDDAYDSDSEHSPIMFSPPTPGPFQVQMPSSEPTLEGMHSLSMPPSLYLDENGLPLKMITRESVPSDIDIERATSYGVEGCRSDEDEDKFDDGPAIIYEVSRRPLLRSQSYAHVRTLPIPPSASRMNTISVTAAQPSSDSLPAPPRRALPTPGKPPRPSGARPSTSHGPSRSDPMQMRRIARPSTSHAPSAPSNAFNQTWHPRQTSSPSRETPFVRQVEGGELLLSTAWNQKGEVRRGERNQGWSGEWNRADMQDVIQKLRELK